MLYDNNFEVVPPCDRCAHRGICKYEIDMSNVAYDINNNLASKDLAKLTGVLSRISLKCEKMQLS